MASPRTLAWVERLVWVLIYAGVFALILGIATHGEHLVAGWSLGVLGGIAVAGGVLLIWVRSRLRETTAGGAQSSDQPPGQETR
jgi:vacuolar-type H+-ATPase subunit I/STV1